MRRPHHRPRAIALPLTRPSPDARWLALAVAAMAALYGVLGRGGL